MIKTALAVVVGIYAYNCFFQITSKWRLIQIRTQFTTLKSQNLLLQVL